MSLSRHAVRSRLVESLKENFLNARVGIIFLLMVILMGSAFAVIVTKFEHRQYMILEQKAKKQKETLRIEWTQILLEHSSLASPNRVEIVAKNQLNMNLPEPKNIQVIKE